MVSEMENYLLLCYITIYSKRVDSHNKDCYVVWFVMNLFGTVILGYGFSNLADGVLG